MNVNDAVKHFADEHFRVLGYKYLTTYGKDNAIIKSIVLVYGLEETVKLINEFFAWFPTESFYKQAGATVGVFKTQIPKLMAMKPTPEEKDNEKVGKL